MTCRVSLMMLILMAQITTLVYAADESVAEDPATDFIEFLGEWETADGEWIDPNELETVDDTQADVDLDLVPVEGQDND